MKVNEDVSTNVQGDVAPSRGSPWILINMLQKKKTIFLSHTEKCPSVGELVPVFGWCLYVSHDEFLFISVLLITSAIGPHLFCSLAEIIQNNHIFSFWCIVCEHGWNIVKFCFFFLYLCVCWLIFKGVPLYDIQCLLVDVSLLWTVIHTTSLVTVLSR